MSETHIHIHLNGEAATPAAPTVTRRKKSRSKTSAKASPTKKPRAVSPYHKTVGKELKRLKKEHPRMSPASRMKKAHKFAKKKHQR